jgi:ribosomal protein S18 acetylase RimI-like enzyme
MTAGLVSASVQTGGSSFVRVAELQCDQWPVLQMMRLDALQNAPGAFVSTSAAERELESDDWQARFTDATWVVARRGLEFVGIARLALPEDDLPWVRFVESVWVDPRFRRQGVLREMLEHLEGLARTEGATELRLWVLDANESAFDAYKKLGFDPMWVSQPTEKRSNGVPVMERLMSKPFL